jgi:hypothetical protein
MGTIKSFIFYTTDGFTEDNSCNKIENCQVLGWSKGKTAQQAFKNLIEENLYLKESDFEDIRCQELSNEKVYYFSLRN